MSLLLYINGEKADTEPGQVIAQTRQVNDLNSLEDRQASYTNKFKLPKTANNLRIMNFLTVTGNDSDIPYRKNDCSLYSESGECFVYNGWAQITDSGDDFDVVIYDGIIDLYKAIENKNLSDLDLSELEHLKSAQAIKDSWTQNKPYRYIAADYNGSTGRPNSTNVKLDADYLIPSVNVAWLWDKIFSTYGITYEGSVFNTEDFKNLWMTYPKGVSPEDSEEDVFENDPDEMGYETNGTYTRTYYIGYNAWQTNNLQSLIQNRHLKITEAGYYRLEVAGKITAQNFYNQLKRFRLFLGKNSTFLSSQAVLPWRIIADGLQSGTPFELKSVFRLDAGDSICLMISKSANEGSTYGFAVSAVEDFSLKLVKINQDEYDFAIPFASFSIRDFLKEVIQRFALTLFKDKYSQKYTFYTLQEQLNGGNAVDWSKKFSKKKSEKYVYGSYAKTNWYRYKYNAADEDFNDGAIEVNNELLAESKNVFTSKIYSPERIRTRYLSAMRNVYKMWEKEQEEVTDEETGETELVTKYKSLSGRYYFLRAMRLNKQVALKSRLLQDEITSAFVYAESFRKLSFSDIMQTYYKPVHTLLQKALMVTTELYLTDADIANFDFKKLYYIEQLSGYFIMNKINNYIPGKPVTCELVKVHLSPQDVAVPPQIKIDKVIVTGYTAAVYFTLNMAGASLVLLQHSPANQDNWQQVNSASPNSPSVYFSANGSGNYKIRLQVSEEFTGETYTSQTVNITIPSNTTIYL